MPVSRAIRRLLDVLEIEESEYRTAMELARAELERLRKVLQIGKERERRGRSLIFNSATSGDVADRIAGIEEVQAARRIAATVIAQIGAAETNLNARRQEFLRKRIERRQTETLIEEAEARDDAEAGRRTQRNLDDWYLRRRSKKWDRATEFDRDSRNH